MGGPTLFSIYLTGLGDIIHQHSVNYHLYADDLQLYVSFRPDPNAASAALQRLEECIEEVGAWMTARSLKLNENKSEFMLFGS